jgi:DNA-binding transcriptional regulator of glucitol operon
MKINWHEIKQWGIAMLLFACVVLMSASANWQMRNAKKTVTPQPHYLDITLNGDN